MAPSETNGGKREMILYCPNCWSPIKENEEVCHQCQAEIESFDHLSYFEALVRALNHPERTTRIRAAYILGELKDKRGIKPLVKAINRTPGIRDIFFEEAIVVALGKIDGEEAFPILINLLNHRSFLVRAAVLNSLSRFKTKKVTQAIRMALDDPSPSVQELAMKILRGRSKRGNFNGS
jgi:HEAT repeat protein